MALDRGDVTVSSRTKRAFPAKLLAVIVYGARLLGSLGLPERMPFVPSRMMPGGNVGDTAKCSTVPVILGLKGPTAVPIAAVSGLG